MVVKHYISLLFLTLTLGCFAESSKDDFTQGVHAFKNKQYDEAITHFNKEIKKNPTNVSAFFNLGLSYNAEKKYSKAIWAFEKVLKLTPNNSEAVDNIEQNYLELDNGKHWVSDLSHFERTIYGISSNTWAIISVALSFLTAFLIFLFGKTTSLNKKRGLAVGAFMIVALMIVSIYIAWSDHEFESNHNYAIITKDQIETFRNEDAKNLEKTKIVLEAGTKVKKIEHYKGNRLKVEKMNGDIHFVQNDDIEFI